MQSINLLEERDSLPFWRFAALCADLLALAAGVSVGLLLRQETHFIGSIKLKAAVGAVLLVLVFFNILVWKKGKLEQIELVQQWGQGKRLFSLLLLLFITVSLFFLLIGVEEFRPILTLYFVRAFFFFSAALLLTIILNAHYEHSDWVNFAIAWLGLAVIWALLAYIPLQPSYPFSKSWAETSWFYYASFFYDQKLYGADIPWPFLDIGRPFLLSFAYLLPKPSLAVMRIWQSTLWVGTALLVAWRLSKRLNLTGKTARILYILWGFLWVLLGPIYMHLALVVVIVLWGFDSKRLGKSLFWVGIASIAGGIFRINWMPVPAILGLTLYFLENPIPANKKTLAYLRKPFWIGLTGVGVGVASFLLYAQLSGRADTRITSKFTATFLWERLLPNATLSTGLLFGILFVSAGLLGGIYFVWRQTGYHRLRFGLLAAMLAILFVGGTVASAKIGGGNNLHNYDAYLSMLMVWGSYAFAGCIQSEKTEPSQNPRALRLFLLSVVLTTVFWSILPARAFQLHDLETAKKELAQLNEFLQHADKAGERVLMIYSRHLLTFDLIESIELLPEYELEELTEIAISNNAAAAEAFRKSLVGREYDLIVTRVERDVIQGDDKPFAAENNAWVRTVSARLLNQYELVFYLPESGISIYAPKP